MKTDRTSRPSTPKKTQRKANTYLKYSGMASQLLVLIFFAIWLGGKIDQYFEVQKKWFTALLVLVFFCGWFFQLYRDVTKKPD